MTLTVTFPEAVADGQIPGLEDVGHADLLEVDHQLAFTALVARVAGTGPLAAQRTRVSHIGDHQQRCVAVL